MSIPFSETILTEQPAIFIGLAMVRNNTPKEGLF